MITSPGIASDPSPSPPSSATAAEVKREAFIILSEDLRKARAELDQLHTKYNEVCQQKSQMAEAFLGEFERERSTWESERDRLMKENDILRKELLDLKTFFVEHSRKLAEEVGGGSNTADAKNIDPKSAGTGTDGTQSEDGSKPPRNNSAPEVITKTFNLLRIKHQYDEEKVVHAQRIAKRWLRKRHLLHWATLGTSKCKTFEKLLTYFS